MGIVKGFQIACNLTGPLGDLTGKGDQPSRKMVYKKGTRQRLDTTRAHQAPTGPNREGTQGCSVKSIDKPLGCWTRRVDQPESGAGERCWTSQADNQHGIRTTRGGHTEVFWLVNRVSLESTIHYRR